MLENPKYMRNPQLGGFSPAVSDSWKTVYRAKIVPEAELAGAEVGDQSYEEDPGESVQEEFSLSGGTGEKFPVPGMEDAPVMDAVPQGISSEEIVKIFQPLFQQIDQQASPTPRVSAPPTPAMATFLSVLAGSLGAQLTRNPRVQESILQTLQDHENRRQAIEDQNYAQDLLFNQQKAARRLAATGQQLEAQFLEAQKAGDSKRMLDIQTHLAKLEGFMKERGLAQAGNIQRGLQEQEAALKVKIAKATPKSAAAEKTLEPKDYTSQRVELQKARAKAPGGWFGSPGERGEVTKEIADLDKQALLSGNPKTAAAAKRFIQQTVLKTLGIKPAAVMDPKTSRRIADKLKELYDLEPGEVFEIEGAPKQVLPIDKPALGRDEPLAAGEEEADLEFAEGEEEE